MSNGNNPNNSDLEPTRIQKREGKEEQQEDPDRIGAYRLIRELGSGGMGKVFLAEQNEPVHRHVALKLISASGDDGLVKALFEFERQTLARLHHPYIAQVYDAGTAEDGRPWFAMELVRGDPIVKHCRHQDLALKERLELFIRVCKGIQHAHQRGIIHRDLKPANILVSRVDGESIPRIIDFGVAASLDPAVSKKRGGKQLQVGTPAYMSPEQLNQKDGTSRISVRCDVYALGVILFELLLEHRPPRSSSESQLRHLCSSLKHWRGTTQLPRDLRQSESDQAVPLTELVEKARQLPYELRCILATALAYDADQRYQSAEALGDDLARFLDHQPVGAVPRTRLYVWRKYLWRHRIATAFIGLVSLSLITGLALALWGMIEAGSQRDLARAEAERAQHSLDFVAQMLRSIDPDYAASGDTALLQDLLANAARRAFTLLEAEPETEAEIQHIIGSTYLALHDYPDAEMHLQRALELAEQTKRTDLALRAMNSLALLYMNDRQFERSEAMFDAMAEHNRDLIRHQKLHLDMLSHRGYLYAQTGRTELARQSVQPVLKETEGEIDEDLIPVRLSALVTTGISHLADNAYAEAEAAYLEHERVARSWDSPMARRLLSEGLNGRAIVYLEQQRHADAEPLLRESLALTRQRLGDDHPLTMPALSNLGSSLRFQGRFDEAAEIIRQALQIARNHQGEESFAATMISYNLGNLLREAGEIREALTLHRWVVETVSADPNPNLPVYLAGLGQTELAAGHDPRATQALQAAAPDLIERFGSSHYRTREAIENLVIALDNTGQADQADQWREFLATHSPEGEADD
jgi:eukaryotic-like serine/threonine-protein kinase